MLTTFCVETSGFQTHALVPKPSYSQLFCKAGWYNVTLEHESKAYTLCSCFTRVILNGCINTASIPLTPPILLWYHITILGLFAVATCTSLFALFNTGSMSKPFKLSNMVAGRAARLLALLCGPLSTKGMNFTLAGVIAFLCHSQTRVSSKMRARILNVAFFFLWRYDV